VSTGTFKSVKLRLRPSVCLVAWCGGVSFCVERTDDSLCLDVVFSRGITQAINLKRLKPGLSEYLLEPSPYSKVRYKS